MIIIIPDHKIVSVNETAHQHWAKRMKMVKNSHEIIWYYLHEAKKDINLPCIIKLTRIAPKSLDDDNLVASFKNLRDAIADQIIPGLAPGQADGDKRITWQYDQRRGKPREYAVEIEITLP